MENVFQIIAEKRDDEGKGASRRLRRAGRVPGILYGGEGEPVSISVDANRFAQQIQNEAFFSRVLEVKIGNQKERAIVRDLQRHPARPVILHFDLQRVVAGEEITMSVPLHFINEETAPGVKLGGGVVVHFMVDIEIKCLPKDLPEAIEVDLGQLRLGESIHLSELKLPAGVKLAEEIEDEENDQPVVGIESPRAERAEEESAEGAEGAEGEEKSSE